MFSFLFRGSSDYFSLANHSSLLSKPVPESSSMCTGQLSQHQSTMARKTTVLPGCFKENRLKRNKYKRQRRLLQFWLVYNFLSILLCQNVRRKEALVPWYQASGSLAAPSLFLTGVSPSSLMTEVKRR